MLLLVLAAFAAEPAYWSADGVAGNSTWFGKAQSRDAKAYELATSGLERSKKAVSSLELGVSLTGNPADLNGFTDTARRELAAQFLRLQRHADLLGSDYEKVFGDAVQRALPTVGKGYDLKECGPPSGIAAMLKNTSAGCKGADLNVPLAHAIDADPALQKAVADILTVEWPTIQLTTKVAAVIPLTGSARTVEAAAVAKLLRREQLDAAQDDYDVAVEQLAEELDSTDPTVKQAAIAKAEAAHDAWAKKVAVIGVGLWPELTKKLKSAKLKDVGLCPNPATTGGCGAPDATREILDMLREE